jgi:hypothetical protein
MNHYEELGIKPQECLKRLRLEKSADSLLVAFGIGMSLLLALALYQTNDFSYVREVEAEEIDYVELDAYITGYNSVPEQTDSTPCIGASGKNLCGRTDALACPRSYALGTIVEIDSKFYVCEDRLSKKYDNRWDVNCDKDMACPNRITGTTTIKIYN